ncbi:FUN14 domain containing protein 1 [Echinococcus multilocularis]|uniref:FUN14 domain containing protein 1 n=1 Tax=Echinococcus multilocularis TaxID=6211 RepID=A0A087VXJ9_ECHMU|nr:FUN14 domain containing protein 1 [Echinococcus multilocularis]
MSAQQAVDEISTLAGNALGEIKKKPTMQQILIGAASGLATGYVLTKVGKSVAFCVGVSAIGLQFFVNHKSNEDWKKLEDDAREVLGKVVLTAKQNKSPPSKVSALLRENQLFTILTGMSLPTSDFAALWSNNIVRPPIFLLIKQLSKFALPFSVYRCAGVVWGLGGGPV